MFPHTKNLIWALIGVNQTTKTKRKLAAAPSDIFGRGDESHF